MAYTRQLFNLAVKKGIIERNPVYSIDNLGEIKVRERVLDFSEIWKFWNLIENTKIPPVTANALKFMLATMQRGNEVRHMKYRSYKPDENIWHMSTQDTKNKTMHRVALNRYALDIINTVKPYTYESQYIFGATRAKTPPKSPKKELAPLGKTAFPQAIRDNLDTLKIKEFTPHDLRRTAATWITAVGLPELYAKLMLNHKERKTNTTSIVYIQYSYDFEKQRAAKVWEFILDQIVNCNSMEEIPNLDEMRKRVTQSGLL